MLQSGAGDAYRALTRALPAVREDLGDVGLFRREGEFDATRWIDGDRIVGATPVLLQHVCRERAKDGQVGCCVVLTGHLASRERNWLLLECIEDVALLLRLAVRHHGRHLDHLRIARLGGHGKGGTHLVCHEGALVVLVDEVPRDRRDGRVGAGPHAQSEFSASGLRLLRRVDSDLVVVRIDEVLEGHRDAGCGCKLCEAAVPAIRLANLLAGVEREGDGARDGAAIADDAKSDDGLHDPLERVGVFQHLIDLILRAAHVDRGEEAGLGTGLHEPLRVDGLVRDAGDRAFEHHLASLGGAGGKE